MKARCGCGDRFSGALHCQTCGTFIWSTASAACACPVNFCSDPPSLTATEKALASEDEIGVRWYDEIIVQRILADRMTAPQQASRPGKKDGAADLDLPSEMDDQVWGCSMCDGYSAELAAAENRAEEAERLRALWFNENSAAQAALGRARELADALLAAGCHYGHQQGETSECNACTAFLFISTIDGRGA